MVLVYVDDILADGPEDSIKWFFDQIADRFECKDDQWLTPETPIDFLGMDISMDANNVYMSMGNYIAKALQGLEALGITNHEVSTPMDEEITDLTPLPKELDKVTSTAPSVPTRPAVRAFLHV